MSYWRAALLLCALAVSVVEVGADSTSSQPLLDRSKVRAPLAVACNGGPDGTGTPLADDAPLPLDPRTLVVPGINKPGAAVQYNAYWIELHNAPGFRPNPLQRAQTCGEWRARVAAGQEFLETRQTFQLLGSARAYDDLWKAWGFSERPPDFEQQVMQRYGLSAAKFRNPYPVPGEDPKQTNGGRGQLPLGLIQGRDRDLGYNGRITISCSACHDSQLGTDADGLGFHWGRATDAFDASLFGAELIRAGFMDGELPAPAVVGAGVIPFPYSAGRGINDAFGLIDFLAALFDMETLDMSPGVEIFPAHGAPGQVQTPNWWNRSHRTRMFLGGDLSADNVRSAMALDVANVDKTGAEKKAAEPDFENVVAFLESLSPPPYPKPIDTDLAEAGAVLFHTKNLWADPANQNRPRPPTNGSCAGCHGVYSPRYAVDPTMLPDPRLKGIVGYITPIGIIGTDPARTKLAAQEFKIAWDTSWWGYDNLNAGWTPDGQGAAGTTLARAVNDYSPTNARLSGPNVWEKTINGYDTPPLYGVWASAPYFHNGSVPTIWDVLRPSDRPAVWQRRLAAPASSGIIQGFDPSFDAYDFEKQGWKNTEIPCNATIPQLALVTCNPSGTPIDTAYGTTSNTVGPYLWLGDQVPAPTSEGERMRRMIYNTHDYSLGNGGHEFTQVLTDEEIAAIIEYLKTL
jgi:mono/diheme cytochrome c family protein